MGQVASAVTALVSLVLAVRLGQRFWQRRRLHSLLYALGLALAAVAAGADFAALTAGRWPVAAYRLYWFSASALVGLMGMGSGLLVMALLSQQRVARSLMAVVNGALALLVVWLAAAAATFAINPELLAAAGELATRAPAGVKLPFVLTSSIGALVIFGGAIWSWWKSRRSYNLLIALGTLFFAAGGAAGNLGGVAGFYGAHLLGSIILYLGVAGSLEPRPQSGPSAAAS